MPRPREDEVEPAESRRGGRDGQDGYSEEGGRRGGNSKPKSRHPKQFADTVYKKYSKKTRGDDSTFPDGDDADVAEQVIFQDKSGSKFADPLDELVYKYNTQGKNKDFFKHYSANFDKRAADGITRGSKKRSSEEGFSKRDKREFETERKDFSLPGPRQYGSKEGDTADV